MSCHFQPPLVDVTKHRAPQTGILYQLHDLLLREGDAFKAADWWQVAAHMV
jgi:hypothetical protein